VTFAVIVGWANCGLVKSTVGVFDFFNRQQQQRHIQPHSCTFQKIIVEVAEATRQFGQAPVIKG
jgi:hypothetical protein